MMKALPLLFTNLPASTVNCWFLREGERLTPGPFVSLYAQGHVYTLVIPGTELFLQGSTLQRIVSGRGAQVTHGSCLALLQLADTSANIHGESHSSATAQEQAMLFYMDILVHHPSGLQAALVLHSNSYWRWYRRFYPLLALGRMAVLLCLILFGWSLLQSLIFLSGEIIPRGEQSGLLSLLAASTSWVQLIALLCFILHLMLTSVRVISLERQRMHWRRNASRSSSK
jgi:hypothetical protein